MAVTTVSAHPRFSAGALPARFRRIRLLIVGCGDVGLRAADLLPATLGRLALTSSPERREALRGRGIVPLAGDLDDPASLRRLAGLAQRVLVLAPPPGQGEGDPRTVALLRALALRTRPRALVYGSTSGVYGDCGGALIDETRAVRPATARGRRRVAAEQAVRRFGRGGSRVSVLRIPGIYAPDREGGTPRARLLRGTPVLREEDDVHTSHIHADDLARACLAAMWRGGAQRVYHVNDDTRLKMGDYFALAARLYGLPPPPRVDRATAAALLSPMQLSFMSESRQLDAGRMKRELGLRLRYPTVADGLA
ncbi:sugar nucleotide-binding protein [Xylophilus rhododendri]|uniref:Sugar nucleotide-binding protein n=1 Tax=Xylophilus rhododendri TaxID=2697032 RepID=A0A857JFE7_9BURK|nr:NAD-dependent epimerase/dehydratase family protein [Xylophilus rhododendri]QHJ01396.1 sugar nucleotide-binding protein [Xylophilus rhododendri]